MHLTQHLEIDNSPEYAVKTGSWKKPGAKLYRKIMNKVEWQELLAEIYLVTSLDNIKNEESGITPYRECSLEYPHHVLQNEKLVLSIPALEAAYAEVKARGICHGELMRHLERHVQELKELLGFDMTITSNLEDVCASICEISETADVFSDESPTTKEEALQELFLRRQNNTTYTYKAYNQIRYTTNEVDALRSILQERKK